jgi:hypothetical protein
METMYTLTDENGYCTVHIYQKYFFQLFSDLISGQKSRWVGFYRICFSRKLTEV